MDITESLIVNDREEWRVWLMEHHATKKEVWLIFSRSVSDQPSITYLQAVEEALCFGWIDGIAKTMDAKRTAQRFTPRRPHSHWTELNKERARRLIAHGRMTPAGLAVLPNLAPESFRIADDILARLQSDSLVWRNFESFPDVYKRIRVGYIEEMRKRPKEFKTRLENFMKKTRENKMFGVIE